MDSQHFTPIELEFYATTSNQLTIIPTYNDSEIFLIGKTIGPFKAGIETVVPAWLAIFLREKNKCKILAPDLFEISELKRFVESENASNDPVFLHEECFFELAYTLLNRAPDTFQKPREVRSLVETLETIRFLKLRKAIQNSTGGRRLKYFTSYEINKWRSGLSSMQKMVDKLGASQTSNNN